jgi:hypothetical protein
MLREPVPRHHVVFNLEQVTPDTKWLDESYLSLLKNHRVWDYSALNIRGLAALGVHASLCEIGYARALTRIPPAAVRDIDVVFVGSINERRQRLLRDLSDAGHRVEARFGIYGPERDALYARSRLVLNVHYYEAKVLELVRISYLLANKLCVVSESGLDGTLEASLSEGIAFAAYDELVATCSRLLAGEPMREKVARRGFELFTSRNQAEMLNSALATLT